MVYSVVAEVLMVLTIGVSSFGDNLVLMLFVNKFLFCFALLRTKYIMLVAVFAMLIVLLC